TPTSTETTAIRRHSRVGSQATTASAIGSLASTPTVAAAANSAKDPIEIATVATPTAPIAAPSVRYGSSNWKRWGVRDTTATSANPAARVDTPIRRAD